MRARWALGGMVLLVATATQAQLPVEITQSQSVPGPETACPNMPQTAQRYFLSDGRTVLLCGPAVPDPVAFINAAGILGLVVGAAPAEDPFAPEVPVDALPDADPQPDAPGPVDQVVAPVAPPPVGVPQPVPPLPAPEPRVTLPKLAKQPPPMGRCANQRRCYVQLGAFADPANVNRAKASLRDMSLPVATQQMTLRDGRVLTGVLAGPFTAAQAEKAVLQIRKAGFRSALLR